MMRHSAIGRESFGHAVEILVSPKRPAVYRLSWGFDSNPGPRGSLIPHTVGRLTDFSGAVMFASKWCIPPVELPADVAGEIELRINA